MIIEEKIPTYCSNPMLGFSKMLGGPNYFPFIRSYNFTFSGEVIFTLENLQDILPHSGVAGALKPTSESDIQDVLYEIMSNEVNEQGVIVKTANEDLIIARVLFFWDCVHADFYQPMTHFFIHKPAAGSYFTDTTLWSFCFIVANATKGMVVSGKTWQSAAACASLNANEEESRNVELML